MGNGGRRSRFSRDSESMNEVAQQLRKPGKGKK